MEKDEIKKEDFTLSLAIVDAIPVLLFTASGLIVSKYFGSIIFFIGFIVCTLAGLFKVLWKIILASSEKNVFWLNKQFRFVMPSGFAIIILSLIVNYKHISLSRIGSSITQFPSLLFFIIGVLCLIVMTVLAKKFNQNVARSNWIEEAINIVAQTCFLTGLILL